jgi:putative glutamine amidotransferase
VEDRDPLLNPERPLIAVTTSLAPVGAHGLPGVKLNAQYIASVEGPGGATLLLTPAHDLASVEQIVGVAHGLMLTGGEDVDPARYGQSPHPTVTSVNPARDAVELAALAAAVRRGIPVLGICRGMQVLNVGLGGTLIQDIPSQRKGGLLHEQSAPVDKEWHHATVEEGSGLAAIFGTRALFINSFHHQAVDILGDGLRASAWAEDGVVEGVEGTGDTWICGVQWHPERGEAEAPQDQRDPNRRLFWAFVQAAREFASGAARPVGAAAG